MKFDRDGAKDGSKPAIILKEPMPLAVIMMLWGLARAIQVIEWNRK